MGSRLSTLKNNTNPPKNTISRLKPCYKENTEKTKLFINNITRNKLLVSPLKIEKIGISSILYCKLLRFFKLFSFSKNEKKVKILKFHKSQNISNKLMSFMGLALKIMKFIRNLKWKSAARTLNLITEREILLIDDATYFTLNSKESIFNSKYPKFNAFISKHRFSFKFLLIF